MSFVEEENSQKPRVHVECSDENSWKCYHSRAAIRRGFLANSIESCEKSVPSRS